jgi:hypothetical protein
LTKKERGTGKRITKKLVIMNDGKCTEHSEEKVPTEDTRIISVFDVQYFEDHGHSKTNPLAGLGSGDCTLYLNVLPDDLAFSIFEDMDREIEWYVVFHH